MHRHKLFQTNKTELKSDLRIEGGEAVLLNCGQTTDATRWHYLSAMII